MPWLIWISTWAVPGLGTYCAVPGTTDRASPGPEGPCRAWAAGHQTPSPARPLVLGRTAHYNTWRAIPDMAQFMSGQAKLARCPPLIRADLIHDPCELWNTVLIINIARNLKPI